MLTYRLSLMLMIQLIINPITNYNLSLMSRYQKCVWDLVEHPESSCAANLVSFISMMFVIVSTIGMCLNTMPGLKVVDQNSELQNNPMLERVEAVCIAWFTMEFVIRLDQLVSPGTRLDCGNNN